MNYMMMGRFVGRILLVEAVFMVPSLLISLVKQESMARIGFAASICITLFLSLLLLVLCKGSRRSFKARDGLVCVGVSWIVMSLLGCLPFYISREIPSYLDALFETVSGFTTTGSSILSEIEGLSMSIGGVSRTGWAVWVCWCLCWLWAHPVRAARVLPCIFCGRRARDRRWESLFRR